MNIKHTDSVEAVVDQMCSIIGEYNDYGSIDGEMTSRLATLIRTALQATQSQQVEEAIKTRFRALCTINDDGDCKYFRDDIHTRLLRGDKFVAEEILQALTSNHQD